MGSAPASAANTPGAGQPIRKVDMPKGTRSTPQRHLRGSIALERSPVSTCTNAKTDGTFCGGPVPPDAPVSVCGPHLRAAYAYCVDMIDRASDAQIQTIRDTIPRLDNQRLMDRVRKARSVVYYALVDGYIKIGTTIHLDERMRALGANLIAVEPGDYDLEKDRHRQFAPLLAAGREYFLPGRDLVSHVAALQDRYTDRDPSRTHPRGRVSPQGPKR